MKNRRGEERDGFLERLLLFIVWGGKGLRGGGQGLRVGKGGGDIGKEDGGREWGVLWCMWVDWCNTIHNISKRKAKKDPASMSISIYALHIYRLIDCGSDPSAIDGVDSR